MSLFVVVIVVVVVFVYLLLPCVCDCGCYCCCCCLRLLLLCVLRVLAVGATVVRDCCCWRGCSLLWFVVVVVCVFGCC